MYAASKENSEYKYCKACAKVSLPFFATVHPPFLPSRHRHRRRGVFTNSMIGQDHRKRQAGHLALYFPYLLKERRDVLSVSRRPADDERELYGPVMSTFSSGSTQR